MQNNFYVPGGRVSPIDSPIGELANSQSRFVHYASLNGNARFLALKCPMASLNRNVRPLVLEFWTPYFGFLLNLALFALCTFF